MKINLFLFLFLACSFSIAGEITLEERELMVKGFPCMSCHGNIKNDQAIFPLKKPHNSMKFDHMDSVKNCYQCHDKNNRNALVLQGGEKIGFNDSHRQCSQCHGLKKRDWELGMHGKMVGSWSGDKYKYTCTNCHEPHHPKFRKMKADPAPDNHDRNKNQGAHK